MATMQDARRAHYSRPNPQLLCGKRDTLTPTITEKREVFYSVRIGDKTRLCTSATEVNGILAKNPAARVVKSERVTTVQTTHKRIR